MPFVEYKENPIEECDIEVEDQMIIDYEENLELDQSKRIKNPIKRQKGSNKEQKENAFVDDEINKETDDSQYDIRKDKTKKNDDDDKVKTLSLLKIPIHVAVAIEQKLVTDKSTEDESSFISQLFNDNYIENLSGFMSRFPYDIIILIFRYFEPKVLLCKLQLVSKKWREIIINSDCLWINFLSEDGVDLNNIHRNLSISPSSNHLYSDIYHKYCILKKNWICGNYKEISIKGKFDNYPLGLQMDGEKIIINSAFNDINIYEIATGRLIKTLGLSKTINSLQFIDNTLVSNCVDDQMIRVWDILEGICTHIFIAHTKPISCFQIVTPQNINPDPQGPPIIEPDATLLVTGSQDTTLKVWRLPNPVIDPPHVLGIDNNNPFYLHTLQGHQGSICVLAASGNNLVSSSHDYSFRAWNIVTGENIWCAQGHTEEKCGWNHKSWNLEDGTNIWTSGGSLCLDPHIIKLYPLSLSHDNLSIFSISELDILDLKNGSSSRHVLPTDDTISMGPIRSFHIDSWKILLGSNILQMCDIGSLKKINNLSAGTFGIWYYCQL
ncbi:13066_t:CDS:2 [Entrophospora sp. SA101]|nr:13066_t:CDS:2 [Entrophospora sp. SA101]